MDKISSLANFAPTKNKDNLRGFLSFSFNIARIVDNLKNVYIAF